MTERFFREGAEGWWPLGLVRLALQTTNPSKEPPMSEDRDDRSNPAGQQVDPVGRGVEGLGVAGGSV
jgi:hypothetical protein